MKGIAKDAVVYMPARAIPAVTGILAVAVYTRLLEPDEYGSYVLAIAAISMTTSIASEWLDRAILRYFEEYRQSGRLAEFTSTIVLSLVGAVVLVLLVWHVIVAFLGTWLSYDLIVLLRVGALVLLTQVSYAIVLALKRARRESATYALYSALNASGKLGIAVLLISFLDLGARGILWGMVTSAGAILLYEISRSYGRWRVRFSHFSKVLMAQLLIYGLPLTGVSMASLLLAYADRYLIAYFLGPADVGTYAASYDISGMSVLFVAGILMLAAYPVIVHDFETRGDSSTANLLTRTTALSIVSLMPIVFGITALSRELATIFLGAAFEAGHEIIPWVSWGAFCFSLTQYVYKPFELKKRTGLLLCLVVIAAALNVTLNLFLIPRFGILGAAYSTLLSYFAYLVSAWLASRKLLTWALPWSSFAKALTASLAMYAVLIYAKAQLSTDLGFFTLEVALGAAVYCLSLCILREESALRALRYLSSRVRVAGHESPRQ